MIFPDLYKCKVAVIGLGYVGLPLAIEIAKRDRCKFTGKNIAVINIVIKKIIVLFSDGKF